MSLKRALKFLEASGFHPEKKLWARARDDLVDVIEPQISRDKQTLTFNLGVAHRKIYSLCWGKEYEAAVGEPYCIARRRLGVLAHGRDQWWPNSDGGVESAIAAIQGDGMRFFDSVCDESGLLSALKGNAGAGSDPLAAVYSALLRYIAGGPTGGEEELRAIAASSSAPWKARVEEILGRLGK